jgi:hypothetical protein
VGPCIAESLAFCGVRVIGSAGVWHMTFGDMVSGAPALSRKIPEIEQELFA